VDGTNQGLCLVFLSSSRRVSKTLHLSRSESSFTGWQGDQRCTIVCRDTQYMSVCACVCRHVHECIRAHVYSCAEVWVLSVGVYVGRCTSMG
jgi:hypothetical protein